MNFQKKGLLSLALSSLTFLSSYGAPSCQAMNETCSVLDYLIQGADSVAETSPSYVYLLLFSSKPVCVFLTALAGKLMSAVYNIFKNYKDKQAYIKFLKENSCGEITKPVYIKRQEGPCWCWIACIQGALKKKGIELSQEKIYELTHNGKKPAFFEFFRNNVGSLYNSEEEVDGIQINENKNYAIVLAKMLEKLNIGSDLYSFYVLDADTDDYTREHYKKAMNLLISTFGSCFGTTDPVVANVTKMPHMILLCDYDETSKKLTFEETYFLKRYQVELDEFAQLCKLGKIKGQYLDRDSEFPLKLVAIGFINDVDKSGYYTLKWVDGQPELLKVNNVSPSLLKFVSEKQKLFDFDELEEFEEYEIPQDNQSLSS